MTDRTTQLEITPDQQTWNDAQLAALRAQGVEGASRADLEIFFHVCKSSGLDPFRRKIYMLGRNTKNKRTQQWETKWTIQTSIDGYRVLASRAAARASEKYGMPVKVWCGPDGEWRDAWLPKEPPAACKVVIEKEGGFQFPAVTRFDEYGQTDRDGNPSGMWRNMPSNQLAKCAEALALRSAYPDDLAGIYVEEEMQQADNVEPEPERKPRAARKATAKVAEPSGRDWLAEIAALDGLSKVQSLWREINTAKEMTDAIATALTARAEALRPIAEDVSPVQATGGKVRDRDLAEVPG